MVLWNYSINYVKRVGFSEKNPPQIIKPYNALKNKFHICKIFKKSKIISYKYTHE